MGDQSRQDGEFYQRIMIDRISDMWHCHIGISPDTSMSYTVTFGTSTQK